MGALTYSTLTSVDGYIVDADGRFDFAMPSEEVHQFVNDLMRPIGTHLYGRRLYEVMRYWETALDEPDPSPVGADFARIWQGADKVVYSRTLDEVSTARTRLEREFDPAVARAIADASPGGALVGGAGLAGEAFRAGLVDAIHLFAVPVMVGGGTRALPEGARIELELVDERRFDNGTVYTHHVPVR